MAPILELAITTLQKKLVGNFDGSVKIHIRGEGSVIVDNSGVHKSNAPSDCTISASPETFKSMLLGKKKAQVAFISGDVTIEGDFNSAMKLKYLLA
ncbi:MAG: SCP2 sterol-binding domain-containing protein [Proteobacteria bacterium]|nr:SCP2 sterol-binding domain-containing protein [Pseudomonadota bacterium]